MNVENLLIKEYGKVQMLTGQHNLEYDLILPDYYDNIGKILKCSVSPFVEAVTSSGDRISIAGSLQLSLLYVGEDLKLYFYENEMKYTKVINNNGYNLNDNFVVEQEVSSLNYRAIGPKRIDLKGMIQISLKVYNNKDISVIQAIESDGVFYKAEKKETVVFKGVFNRLFGVSDEMHTEKGKIRTIIRKNCKISVEEKKTIANKVFIKGVCKLTLIYIEEDTYEIKTLTQDLPFSEVIDAYSVTEDDITDIFDINCKISCNIKNSDGDNSVVAVNIDTSVYLNVYSKIALEYIEDIYATAGEISTVFTDVLMNNTVERKVYNINVSFEADSFAESEYTVCDCCVDDIKLTTEIADGKNKFVLNANYNALLKFSDGTYNLVIRNFTKEFIADSDESKKDVQFADALVLSVSALQLNDGKIRFSADYFIESSLIETCKVKVLTEFVSDEIGKTSTEKGLMLYYAQKGEDIWHIAKDNKACVAAIKSMNNIIEETVSEDKMLVFPVF